MAVSIVYGSWNKPTEITGTSTASLILRAAARFHPEGQLGGGTMVCHVSYVPAEI